MFKNKVKYTLFYTYFLFPQKVKILFYSEFDVLFLNGLYFANFDLWKFRYFCGNWYSFCGNLDIFVVML